MTTDPQQKVAREELGLQGIFDLASGYQRAQVLLAAGELDVFGILAAGPKSAAEVALALGANTRGVGALLEACVALGLLRVSERGYENSRTTGLFLVPGREASFSPVLRFWKHFSYGRWARLTEAVRTNEPQTPDGPKSRDLFDQLFADREQMRLFFHGLEGLAYWPARRLAETVDCSRRTHLLDVGGGSGAYSVAFARRYPHLRVTLVDLEPVCALAQEQFFRIEGNGRLRTLPGDFHRGPLPSGADCALISHVLHDWSEEECLALLDKVHAALEPGGELLIYDFMPDSSHSSVEASLFCLALLLDTNRGRVYTAGEVGRWIEETGFTRLRQEAVTAGTSVVRALKRG